MDTPMVEDSGRRSTDESVRQLLAELRAQLDAETKRTDDLRAADRDVVAEMRQADPTENVKALVQAGFKRIDDLREADSRRVNEIIALHASYNERLQRAEQSRLDAIRAVDVGAVAVAAERQSAQASVLATQLAASAEALRSLVATTATSQAQQLSQIVDAFTSRLAALERSSYEGSGSSGGMRAMYGWLVGAIAVIVAVLGLVLSQ